ncbi:CBS domain containing-hemolysin-like protein [Kribbella orskensis]|uniref:CBS domain containing-hemolysin-like protein n=1 Tax=Kribbella orskensis TaxID=2512216 RepID=A0ABY2BV61_9ACTN|nr:MULTISPECIES: hemolysin family protein [Kribbella]TCN44258.1 CBS domain containing-hemolysin-like protein [Kribbella sp. VKM Ac-2500]TCO31964.1 CBS domain containing-hemolysin-like protein [Kribbella orskensis]
MSTTVALLISVLLLILNGFFVSAEFALVASKRHRLEQAAAQGSRSARAAIAGVSELSLMLAGAQLGITLCTLGLGALAEPAVAHLLHPLFELIGLPDGVGHVISLIIAVGGIGLLHVLLGEMAPKSWAISDPERSALLLALPFRAFTTVFRPLLIVLNGMANLCLRVLKVTPQNELANAHGPEELRLLIESSREHGTLEAAEHDLLTAMLALQNTTVAQVMTPTSQLVTVPDAATAREVELASVREGRSRLAVVSTGTAICGIVHVRDASRATTSGGHTLRAADLMTEPLRLPADTPVAAAIRIMRERRAQLAVVQDGDQPVGVVALEDLLEEVIGEFDDETDPIITAAVKRRSAEAG